MAASDRFASSSSVTFSTCVLIVHTVAEGIGQRSRAVSVELILQRAQFLAPGCDCLRIDRVDILDIDHQADGGPPKRLRALETHVGIFIREHDRRVPDLDLRVPDLASRSRHTEQFDRAKSFRVKLESGGRILHDQIRGNRVVPLWNR